MATQQLSGEIDIPFGLEAFSRITPFEAVSQKDFYAALEQPPGSVSFALSLIEKPKKKLVGESFFEVLGLGSDVMLPCIDIGQVPAKQLADVSFMKHFLNGQPRHISTVYVVLGYSWKVESFYEHLSVLMNGRSNLKVVIVWWFDNLRQVVVFDPVKNHMGDAKLWPSLSPVNGAYDSAFLTAIFFHSYFFNSLEKIFIPLNEFTARLPRHILQDKRIHWEVNEQTFPVPENLQHFILPTVLYTKHDYDFSYGVSDRLKRLHISDRSTLMNARCVGHVQHLSLEMSKLYPMDVSQFLVEKFSNLDSLYIQNNPDAGLTINLDEFPRLMHLTLHGVSSACKVRSLTPHCRLLDTLTISQGEPDIEILKNQPLRLFIKRLHLKYCYTQKSPTTKLQIEKLLSRFSAAVFLDHQLVKFDVTDHLDGLRRNYLEGHRLLKERDNAAKESTDSRQPGLQTRREDRVSLRTN